MLVSSWVILSKVKDMNRTGFRQAAPSRVGRIGTLALLLALFAGCATAPDYTPAARDGDYGYSDRKLESDRYRVQYRLRGENVGKAQDYALLRAAELTLENGGDWFRVVDRSSAVNGGGDRGSRTSIGAGRTITRECGLLGCRTVSSPTIGAHTTIGRFDGEATIVAIEVKTGRGDKPQDDNAYNAAEIAENIRARL